MVKDEVWEPFSWFCPNCSTKAVAYRNKNGDVKAECSNRKCRVVMFRRQKSRRHVMIEVYEPET